MPFLTIALPKTLRTWVDAEVSTGGYGNTSEYIRALIRGDQRRRAREELEKLLLEAFQSGPTSPIDAEDWEALRATVRARLTTEAALDGEAGRPHADGAHAEAPQ